MATQAEMNAHIIAELQDIRNQLTLIQSSCDKMSKHIEFVDEVFDNVRTPFQWLMNKANQLAGIGGSAIQLSNLRVRNIAN